MRRPRLLRVLRGLALLGPLLLGLAGCSVLTDFGRFRAPRPDGGADARAQPPDATAARPDAGSRAP